jgi:uncharacterized membrane protein YfcA
LQGTRLIDAEILLFAAVPIIGFIAGFVNTLAGSGSLITLPILIVLGLPANVANGTNRVGILVQNIVAVATFRRHGALNFAESPKLIVPSVIGAIAGAALAVDLDEALLNRTIGILMIVMLAVILLRPRRWLEAHADGNSIHYGWQVAIYFAIGLYCGFIQAGAGIFLIAGLVLGSGYNLVRGNAMKNLIVLIVTIAALAVFVLNDQVRWGLGLLLASGNAAGAWVGANMAVSRGAGFVRWVLITIIALSAIALFSDYRIV